MDKKALIEIAKSSARYIWFGLLALIVTLLTGLVAGENLAHVYVVIFGQSIDIGFVLLIIFTTIIKVIDRYIHLSQNTASKGIAPEFLQR